jgi:hypothetical protein
MKFVNKLPFCPICGRKHTSGQHKMMTRKSGKQRKYKGGYTYNNKGDKSIKGEDVTYSAISRSISGSKSRSRSRSNSGSNAYGRAFNNKRHNKSQKRM